MRFNFKSLIFILCFFYSGLSVNAIAGYGNKDLAPVAYPYPTGEAATGNQDCETQKYFIISSSRPRLFVRADEAETGIGLTLSELRSRIKDPAYQDWAEGSLKADSRGNMPAVAMQYLLTGDKSHALAVGDYLSRTPLNFGEHTSSAAAVYNSAIAFDWVRDALPDEIAGRISDDLLKGAEQLKGGVIRPAINHNYTIVSLYGLAMAAVAIYGESDEKSRKSLEYIELIDDLLTNDQMLLDAFHQKEGVWGEGNHYTPFVVYYPFLMTMKGLTTSTGTDYFSLIRTQYGRFINPMAKFVIANFRPDFTLERIGDILPTVVPAGTFMRPLLELMASEIDDAVLQGQVRSFSQEMENFFDDPLVRQSSGWLMMVNYDSKLPVEPSYKTLPLVMRLGKNAYEHIMFRNSWEEDGTLISYVSGDQYTHHQHLDKGHFLIFRKGGLIIDGGGYGSPMYGDNWANYSTRTLAHNNVLVYDPDEKPFTGTMGTVIYPDGGQVVQTGNQGQRSWQEFIDVRDSTGLNAANVLAFEYDHLSNDYNYVKSDLTRAYGEKMAWMDRQLLYLPHADYLVVRDRVITGKPMNKYWLLHLEQPPVINGITPGNGITDYEGTSTVRSERTDKMEVGGRSIQNSGALFIKSMLPEERSLSVIGGPGFEYFNRFSNKNFPNTQPFPPVIEPGYWRLETSTENPETVTFFLHALEITDADREEMVETGYIQSEDDKMAGAVFLSKDMHYVVLFSNSKDERGSSFQKAELPVDYSLDAFSPAFHVIAELESGIKLTVNINGVDTGVYTTTGAGILSFKDNGTGTRNIRLVPAE